MDDELAGLLSRLRELVEEAAAPERRATGSQTSEPRTSDVDEPAETTPTE